jgi:hypothetical protein
VACYQIAQSGIGDMGTGKAPVKTGME